MTEEVAIIIPYMVRIIQANFKKWPTIVIIDNILARFQGPYIIFAWSEFFKKWVSSNDMHPAPTSICQTFWATIVIIVLAGALTIIYSPHIKSASHKFLGMVKFNNVDEVQYFHKIVS